MSSPDRATDDQAASSARAAAEAARAAYAAIRAREDAAGEPPLAGPEPLVDVHAHFYHDRTGRADWAAVNAARLRAGERIGIRWHVASILGSWGHTSPTYFASPDDVTLANDVMYALQRAIPGRLRGYVHVNPNFTAHALAEIARGVAAGAVGVKLSASRRADDPLLDPIAELAAEHGLPILHHVWQWRRRDWPMQEASDGVELARLASRHPRTRFLLAHIGGGGDYAHTFAAVRDLPNVHLDLSGSGIDRGMLDAALDAVGPSRLLWACDVTIETGLAKLWALEAIGLPPADLAAIRWHNALHLYPPASFPDLPPSPPAPPPHPPPLHPSRPTPAALPPRPPRQPPPPSAPPEDAPPLAPLPLTPPPLAPPRLDVHLWIGAYPFRALPHPDPSVLVRVLAREGIASGWVGHLPSAFWRDPTPGNALLYEALALHAPTLRPAPAIRPDWPGWERALAEAVDRDAPAVRAYPMQWGLGAGDPSLARLASACAAAGRALVLTTRFEDARQRHPLDVAGDLTPAHVRALARLPDAPALVVCGAGRDFVEETAWSLTPDERARLWFDVSWLWGPPEDHLATLLGTLGAERFVYGTGWPLRLTQGARASLALLPDVHRGAVLADGNQIVATVRSSRERGRGGAR